MLQLLAQVEAELHSGRAVELERRLTIARQLRQGRPVRPGIKARLLIALGDALIAIGQSIRPRVQTA
jgi:hypothetical protein